MKFWPILTRLLTRTQQKNNYTMIVFLCIVGIIITPFVIMKLIGIVDIIDNRCNRLVLEYIKEESKDEYSSGIRKRLQYVSK